MYGDVKNVTYGYYRDAKFEKVKTEQQLVFINLFQGCGVPPFCKVRGQKISVGY